MKDANIICIQCKMEIEIKDSFWDEGGYGYSTKLAECPYCKQLNIVRHVEDYGLNVNEDKRYYKHGI